MAKLRTSSVLQVGSNRKFQEISQSVVVIVLWKLQHLAKLEPDSHNIRGKEASVIPGTW